MIGQTLAHYHIVEKISSGGMGVVYRARDDRLDRDVALKILPAGALADDAARKRFRKEALTVSKLNHPHIAMVYDFDAAGGVDYLAMEYVPGETLQAKLRGGALPEKEVARLREHVSLPFGVARHRSAQPTSHLRRVASQDGNGDTTGRPARSAMSAGRCGAAGR